MISLQKELSSYIADYLRAKITTCIVTDEPFVHIRRDFLSSALEKALGLRPEQVYFYSATVENRPRNKPDYVQTWLASGGEILSNLHQDEYVGFAVIYPHDGHVVSIDLGPDYEGAFELTVSEMDPPRVVTLLHSCFEESGGNRLGTTVIP